MPIATDSGYLPDWLAALIGQGSMGANVPAGLFSDTAASPSPNVGLLSNNPLFTGVRPDAPAFQGGNAGPSNSYPSMMMPQDPGPMNVGPGGAGSSFTGVNPTAPFTANGPNAIQDQYANVPLPPRRPNDLTSFQAQADPQDINTPPPGQPNANVVGTAASGAPEITAQQASSPGLGDYLGKAANMVGSIYGAGGPGDALIALGLSNRTNGASIQALNAGILNRSRQAELALKQAEANDKIKAIAGNVALVRRLYPNLSDAETSAFARNPEMMKQIGQVAAPMEQWSEPYTDNQGNLASRHLRTGETKILQAANETVHPATPEERAQWLAPDDKTPLGISDRTGKPVGVPGGTNVAVYNAPQSAYANQGQESVGKQHIALAEGVDKAQEKLMNLNAMSGALQSIREKGGTTGLGETAKTNLQSYINTLSNAVGYQPFDVSDKELINKFGRLLSANAAKDSQGSRVTNFELDNFLKANPGLELSPQGNERLLGIMQQIEKRKVDLGTELQDRFAAGKPPSIAENHEFVKNYIDKHHIIDPITGQDITANPKLPGTGTASGGASGGGIKVPSFRIIGQ
jgi:hypothetical protein